MRLAATISVTVPAALDFPSNLAIYDGGCLNGRPEILVIGDSIVRFVPVLSPTVSLASEHLMSLNKFLLFWIYTLLFIL